jgi:hypothetical protein
MAGSNAAKMAAVGVFMMFGRTVLMFGRSVVRRVWPGAKRK